ncbi:MAG: DUF4350 domain-containing protein [Acidobacteria bacterium]|nr:DUF4350 domain-containing protein [Acidobacteriota bacterium]
MIALICALAWVGFAQQTPDPDFAPRIEKPAFAEGQGPRVLIDEAHYNFHTVDGRYQSFAEVLRRDGYRVAGSREAFKSETLRAADVLVVANALHKQNAREWKLPTPSAFTGEEIAAVMDWVREGGALLLIADHMPFPGAAMQLGKALGVTFLNGYARQRGQRGPSVFEKSRGMLKPHPVTAGVDRVATFTGSGFRLDQGGEPLLVFDESFESWDVKQASRFPADTPRSPLEGWLQGAALRFGKGRAAVFGEAAMFSAQLSGPDKQPMGMNHPLAAQNPLLLRNLMRWLARSEAVASNASRVIR